MSRRKKLTEMQWSEVFQLRCKSRSGGRFSLDECMLIDAAYREDEKRYGAMDPDVFDTTVPFGSNVRARR